MCEIQQSVCELNFNYKSFDNVLIGEHSQLNKLDYIWINLFFLFFSPFLVIVFWNCNDQEQRDKLAATEHSTSQHHTKLSCSQHTLTYIFRFVRCYFSFQFNILKQQFAWSNIVILAFCPAFVIQFQSIPLRTLIQHRTTT